MSAAHVEVDASPIAILPGGAVKLDPATFGASAPRAPVAGPLVDVERETSASREELERAKRTAEDAERALQRAQHARDAASDAHASDMSEANLAALRAADERVIACRYTVEARHKQLARAREAHEGEVRSRLHAHFEEARTRADVDAAFRACAPVLAKLVELDRAAAPYFEALRRILADQRDALDRAEAFGEVLREAVRDSRPLRLEDVRPLVGALIFEAREAEGRGKDALELFLAPVGPAGSDAAEVVSRVEFDALVKRAHALVGGKGRAR